MSLTKFHYWHHLIALTSSLQTWLLGYELKDTIMVLTSEAIHFLSSKKKIEFLRQIEANKDENNVPPVKLLTRDKVRSQLDQIC